MPGHIIAHSVPIPTQRVSSLQLKGGVESKNRHTHNYVWVISLCRKFMYYTLVAQMSAQGCWQSCVRGAVNSS